MNRNRGRSAKATDRVCREGAETHPPVDPTYSEEGVDLTLIRWMLSLTPEQRLRALQNHVRTILRIRSGRTDR
jgi:hypothetical protein